MHGIDAVCSQTGNMKNHGSLEDFRLVLHGTAEAPHHMKAGPRVYDENYNTVQNERSVSMRTDSAAGDGICHFTTLRLTGACVRRAEREKNSTHLIS